MINSAMQKKISAEITTGRVIKTTDNNMMFYHVIDSTGCPLIQIMAPYSGYGVYEIKYSGRTILNMNWCAKYDFIDTAGMQLREKKYISDLIMTCNRKIQKQITASHSNERAR